MPHPHYGLNMLEMLSRIKRSSLSPQIINYIEKSFVRFDASVLINGSPVCSSNKDNTQREGKWLGAKIINYLPL